MKSNLKKIKDCKIRLSVEVEAGDVENRYQQVLKDFQKKAVLPGFREGKAPSDLVKQRYSKEIEDKTLESLVPEAYHQAVLSSKVAPIMAPKIMDIQFALGKKLTFAAEFESAPNVSIKNYKGIKIKKVGMEVAEEEIEKAIQGLLDSRAQLVPIEVQRPVQKGDFIAADVEIWKEGAYEPGRKDVALFVEEHPEDDFLEKMVGAQVGDAREISANVSEDDKKQGIVGRKPAYKVWVRGLREKKLPKMDDELAKGFGLKTAQELKDAIRKDLAARKRTDSYNQMKQELLDKLVESHSFAIPEGLVERQKQRLVENARKQYLSMGMDPKQLEKEEVKIQAEVQARAASQIKSYFILQKIAELESVDLDEEELERRLTAMAEESKKTIDEVRQSFEHELRDSMQEAKIIEFLMANANYQEK